ncbi:hypothetical protein PAU_01693 [Photorhabdus asymbiotica]|uniref:Uncharacterized protein n=1 Tax=Photorhabdus asymbiotica subsp. asymbiotica (strain ATCC 43949 / 3105-77) TaxID=553480 RepID=C7BSU1_PHOAA|nr:hypothetical protein PAU_01693 [Photorhabdus asymbiotica]
MGDIYLLFKVLIMIFYVINFLFCWFLNDLLNYFNF